jgi:hypothetical protein
VLCCDGHWSLYVFVATAVVIYTSDLLLTLHDTAADAADCSLKRVL